MTKAVAGEYAASASLCFYAWPAEGSRRLLLCVSHVLANELCLVTPSSAVGAYSNEICLCFRQCWFQDCLFPLPAGDPLEKEDTVTMGGQHSGC